MMIHSQVRPFLAGGVIALAFCGVALLNACSDSRQAENTDSKVVEKKTVRITVTGSSTIAPLMSEVAKVYEAKHPGVRIDVQSGGTSRGIADVRNSAADIGMVSREMKPDEADLRSTLLAKDGVSIVAHQSNPISGLTRSQVIDIYAGRIKNWKEVGGKDLPITVVSKAEGRSTLEVFSQYFGLAYKDIRAQVIIGDNMQGIQTVAGNPGAIGYVSVGTAEYEAGRGVAIKLLDLENMKPSAASVANGSYSITRELNLVARDSVRDEVKALLAYSQSPEVAKIITAQFFVPVTK